jgi:hypothetical protein
VSIAFVALCAVLFDRSVILCDMCIHVLYLTVLSLPPGKNPLTVQLNNNNNNNNNIIKTKNKNKNVETRLI